MHAPCEAQVDHADQVPSVQVRVWVPQFPHACDDAPLHVHAPFWQVVPDAQA
jgi:hypothetical protein